MDNTGSPKGGSHDPPVVLFGTKTKVIGRIPSQTALIDEIPLMGSLSRRGGSNNGHPGQFDSGKKPGGGQAHPPAQTSFRQSEVPDHTISPETDKGGDLPKQTNHPPHQTSFPQSESPEQAPSVSPKHQFPDPHPTPGPQTSFTDNQPPHLHSKTNNPTFSKSQDPTFVSTQSFFSSVEHQTPGQTRSFTDNQHSHGHTRFSTQSFSTAILTSVSSHGTSLPISSQSVLNTASTDSVSTANPVPKASSTSVIGTNPHKGGKLSRFHSKAAATSSTFLTSKNQPPDTSSSTSLSSASTPANTKHSHPTGAVPGHNPKTSRLTSPSDPLPATRNPPVHSSHTAPSPPSPQHTHDHQTTPLESQAAPSTQTSTQAVPRPLIPLPKHKSKGQPVPSPSVTTATLPAQHPDKPQPNTIISFTQPSPFSNDPNPQTKPSRPTAVTPTVAIPEPSSPPSGPAPTTAPVLGTETVIPGPNLSSVKAVSAKDLLKPASASFSDSAQPSANVASFTRSQGQASSFVDPLSIPEGSATASAIQNEPHRHPSGDGGRSSASNRSASIIGGVLGAIIGLLVIGFLVIGFCFYRRKLRKVQQKLQFYEKGGDAAPPLYASKSFDPPSVYESRSAYGQPVTSVNQDVNPTQSPPVVTNPFSDATYATQQMHSGNHGFVEGQEVERLAVPGYTKSMNPFTNLASPYPYQANAGDQDLALENEKPPEFPNNGLSQYPVEKHSKEYESWTAVHGKHPHKTFDAHLSKISSATTLSVGSAYTGKRSSAATYINEPDESFGNVEFDSLKMVKPRTATAVGVAM